MGDTGEGPEAFEAYAEEISDGCGCTELWEYMSTWRREQTP